MRAFIYTGGTVYDEYVLEKPQKGDLVISADAGFLTAQRLGITPDVMLGDFDTLGEPKVPEGVECLRLPAEKSVTDTQYAVDLAVARGASELVIVGGLEGRLDHTLSLLSVLEELWSVKERRVHAIITSGKNRVRFVRDSGVILPKSQYRYFSLIAADERVKGITLEGCKYPLKRGELRRLRQWAVSNEVDGNCALVEVHRGGVWVIESMD
ncbi:MAG: thiamine diphosphokinase [Ruminococcaceae bacterium]|nr:thiamine diphosphokinase [Oscillospiraceae bacterium]